MAAVFVKPLPAVERTLTIPKSLNLATFLSSRRMLSLRTVGRKEGGREGKGEGKEGGRGVDVSEGHKHIVAKQKSVTGQLPYNLSDCMSDCQYIIPYDEKCVY